MKIILVAARLDFVSLGNKIHARDQDDMRARSPIRTMCGRAIPSGATVLPTHKLDEQQVCGRCLASLRTYTDGKVRFEEEVSG